MAKTADKLIAELISKYEPRLQHAFLDAINDIRNTAILKTVADLLERGDITGAVEALHLDRDAFSRLEIAIAEAYNGGGLAVVENLPRLTDPNGQPIIFRWGVRNLPAEQELRDHAAQLVTEIVDDQRTGIQRVLTDGLSRGDNPYVTARDIVGRRSRASNARVGGYLGLRSDQMQTVSWIRTGLDQGDEAAMRRYLALELRDRRFDRSVVKAIREGTSLPSDFVNRVADQYANRALDYRGKVVSRHETMVALSKSRNDAFGQQIASGKIDVQDLVKTWRHTAQEHPRFQHIEMDGQTVPFDQPFVAPDGTQLRYPHDERAPARHTLGCKCRSEMSISFTQAALRRYRARVA